MRIHHYKKLLLLFTFMFIGLSSSYSSDTPKNSLSAGINYGYFLTGKLTSVYHHNYGGHAQYSFVNNRKLIPFIEANLSSDIGVKSANLFSTSLVGGLKYQILTIGNKPLHAGLAMGPMLLQERFAIHLVDRIAITTTNTLSIRGGISVSCDMNEYLKVSLTASQWGKQGTNAGVQLSYIF